MSFKERLAKLEDILKSDVIDIKTLKTLVFQGLPGDGSARALTWRLLLDYLPVERSSWAEYLEKKRSNYSNFVTDLLGKKCEEFDDHPLNIQPDSKWQEFFRDNEVLLQIDKDVRRLLPEISFFQSLTLYPCEGIVSGEMDRLHKRVQYSSLRGGDVQRKGLGLVTTNNDKSVSSLSSGECHWEVVERILFLYAKLNPGQGYVQGMNEIIGPIYYTLANDNDTHYARHAESDTFYMFTNLMGEIRDFFIRSLDNSKSGIKWMMERLMDKIKNRDNQVYNLLTLQDIHPQYYAFRWISLLLSQEFSLPDVLRIWDSLLADESRFNFLIDLCCAMIMHIRGDLLSSDFSNNMKLLQNYPQIDVRDILHLATTFL